MKEAKLLSEYLIPKPNKRWGRWRHLKRLNVLRCKDEDGRNLYEIDLDKCTSSAAVLDWIMQVSMKTWCSTQDKADLLEAIRQTLNPQENLCSFGVERGRVR